jgi:hypothetical protein
MMTTSRGNVNNMRHGEMMMICFAVMEAQCIVHSAAAGWLLYVTSERIAPRSERAAGRSTNVYIIMAHTTHEHL